ncbi:hypothetical protein FRC06_004757, partial [Ceratobasidium sp. 370]
MELVAHTHWAGRAGFRHNSSVLRLPHDVLLEVACLLDVPTLLALRQVCRLLSTLTREPVIFVRLLASTRVPPLPRPLPASLAPSPEQRVVRACRLHKNWDLAALPVTVRTTRAHAVPNRASVPRVLPPPKPAAPPAEPPLAAPLPYHLPPGADAYPFLKLETYAPFRDTVAKSKPSFGPVAQSDPAFATSSLLNRPRARGSHQPGSEPVLAPGAGAALQAVLPMSTPGSSSIAIQSHSQSTPQSHLQSQAHTQPLPALHPSVPPHCGNFVATAIRAWHVYPPAPSESGSSSVSDLTIQGSSQPYSAHQSMVPSSAGPTRSFTPNPVHSAPTPPPAPTPRPTRVTSVTARAIFAKIVPGGKWGVFVVKRTPGSGSGSTLGPETGSDTVSRDKGKQKADSHPLTAEALAHLSQAEAVDRKGKGKAKAVPIDGEGVAQWAGESANGNAASMGGVGEAGKNGPKSDGEVFLVVYDLDAADGALEKGKMAEFPMKWTPAGMACRATRNGVVIALVSGMSEGVYTTVLRWSYMSSSLTHLGSHKSKCPLGAISIQECEAEGRTLVSIVHRPWTVMIQDVDSGQRCFVKLSKIPPRHTLQAIHLLPGRRLLVLRKIQATDPDSQAFVLEEYEVPAAGESVYPAGPVQRQWIRGMDLHGCMLVEGPTYENGSQPDIALWAFSTLPHRAVVHW